MTGEEAMVRGVEVAWILGLVVKMERVIRLQLHLRV
jgi:hypothetical protein